MSNYIPYPFFHDDVPIDISFVFEKEKPAGKHGFLTVNNRDFVFEDGTKVKFWGTNFNGCGCFPDKDYAEKLARRLAKIGINIVRFHQLDSEWHTPNIFAFTKGKRVTNGHLDPESMDRLDYLIYCLKKEGIYCYMDMFTYRKFRSDEGVEYAKILKDAAKPICMFDDKLIELQKELCQELWQHSNPYTGLKYCDDPVFVMAEITNECDLFLERFYPLPEPYNTEFLAKFDIWLKDNNIDKKACDFDLLNFDDETIIDFKIYMQEKYFKDMRDHMRECGVKIPITGTNWTSSPANLKTHLIMDFFDNHSYHYDWNWKEYEKHCANDAITKTTKSYFSGSAHKGEAKPISYLSVCGLSSAEDKPTFISEWDMPWPNDYRAESPIYSAAIGMLQGWSGFTIHTYSYSASLDKMKMLGKEIASEKIGGTPYRQGIFSTWNDPAKFGLFYHAALITRRGDVATAKNTVEIKPFSKSKWNMTSAGANIEKSRIISDFSFEGEPQDTITAVEDVVVSDTGELLIDRVKNYGYVNTDMTKCAYGFLGKNGEVDLSGVKVNCETDFAVIAMSSLTDSPITSSDNILLTTVGRARNTDAKFEKDLMLDIGKPPVLIESICADIEIETNVDGLVVWAISPEGFYVGTVPTTYQDGKLSFRVGEQSETMYYLIVKE